MTLITDNVNAIDSELSNRSLDLDPNGYFIIYIDRASGLICAKHYTNAINERGLAVNPETGKIIPAKGQVQRTQNTLFTGRTAKELCVQVFEKTPPCLVSMLNHAAYLGREFVRAEIALISGRDYIQD